MLSQLEGKCCFNDLMVSILVLLGFSLKTDDIYGRIYFEFLCEVQDFQIAKINR